jgi:menaquinol-cytochrome c reductase iron-sulfur subunit
VNSGKQPSGPNRRAFYVAAIYGIWAAITAAFSLPALIYLLFPPKAKKNNDWVDAGDVSKLAVNSPLEMVFRQNRVDGWKVTSEKSTAWVVKQADNSVVAFGPQCTHLGCAYHWEDTKNEFLCPCHSSLFAIDGRVISGPAPRPLDRYEVKVSGTRLLIGPLRKPEQSA